MHTIRRGYLGVMVSPAMSRDPVLLLGPPLYHTGSLRKGQILSQPLFLSPTADKGSQCEKQLCACDKELATCLKESLSTYNKRLRIYWRPSCRGQTPIC